MKSKKTTKKTTKNWKSSNYVTVSTGVRYNSNSGMYYVRKAGSYVGSYPSIKKAQSAYASWS